MKDKMQGMLRWYLLVAFGVLLYVSLQNVQQILGLIGSIIDIFKPFIYGIGLAYLIDTLVRWLHKTWLKNHRGLAILLSYMIFIAVIVLLFFAIIPQSIQSVQGIIHNFDYYIDQIDTGLQWINSKTGADLSVSNLLKVDSIQIGEAISQFMDKYQYKMVDTGGQIAQTAVTIFTAFAASIYILLDKYKLKRQVLKTLYQMLSSEKVDFICRVAMIFDKSTTNFFVGKILDSLIIGVLTFILMLIFKIPCAVLVQTVVGITNIIPIFGPFIGAIPGVLLIFIEDPLKALEFLVIIVIIQQLDGNFIGPKILGQTSNVQAFWILFQIIVGGNTAGVLGMVLGIPVFSVVQTLIQEYQDQVLKSKGLDDKFEGT